MSLSFIPDRDANRWEQTDPISQIEWTHDKNRRTNGHFVNVVKGFQVVVGTAQLRQTRCPKGILSLSA